MKKLLLFCLFLIAFSGKCRAQDGKENALTQPTRCRNSVYGEFGGNALLGSVNYERLFYFAGGRRTLALRCGALFVPQGKDLGRFEYDFAIPAEITFISGKKGLRWEAGAGATYHENSDTHYGLAAPETDKLRMVLPTLRIGGRWQPAELPFFLRAGLTALFFGEHNPYSFFPAVTPWPAVGFGYSFR